MQPRLTRLPAVMAPSLAQALRASGRVAEEAPGPGMLLRGAVAGEALRIFSDGRIEFNPAPDAQALLLQCIKGILPLVDAAFVVGIDEAGMGGEATNPVVAIVLLPSEVRAELVVAGVSDSKQVPAHQLGEASDAVLARALRVEVVQVQGQAPSHAANVATAVASKILEWDDGGHLPASARITMDQTDVNALAAAFGGEWPRFQERIRVEAKADERHVEVAAASVLARSNRVPGAKPPQVAPITVGMFRIGPSEEKDRDQILQHLADLQHSYPDIGKWIGKEGDPKSVWERVRSGHYHLVVARMNELVTGFCLSQRKDERNVKLSTFFVIPRYRRQHIGHRMLEQELARMASTGTRRVMVTFGHEEFNAMAPFFREHGFTVDGISPQRYRDNSYEVVMGKRFRHGGITSADFDTFVEADVFRLQGFDITPLEPGWFLAEPTSTLVLGPARKAARLLVHVTTNETPEAALPEIRRRAKEHGAAPLLASSFGFPCDTALPADLEVMDALVLERMFSPVRIQRPTDQDVVIPIKPEYAAVLFPEPKQATIAPSKVGLRTTNVYYKVAKGDGGLRRASRIFFYESEGRGVFGYGLMERIITGPPKWVYGQTRDLGAWNLASIQEHVGSQDAAAYRFRAFRRLKRPVSGDEIKAIYPSFFPVTAYRIPSPIGNAIIDLGAKPV